MKKIIEKYILNSDFFRVVISFIIFLLVTAEAVCGFWLNSYYKADMAFGENTYYAGTSGYEFTMTYAEIKNILPDTDFSKLDRLPEDTGVKEVVYNPFENKEIVYKDSDKFFRDAVFQYYVENVLLKKYKDHMVATWNSCVMPIGGGYSSLNCEFVACPEYLLKEGRMCVAPNECVCISGVSVGDDVYIAGDAAKVTGVISDWSECPKGNALPALLCYFNYRTSYNGPRLCRSYDQLDEDHMISGREYDFLSLYCIKFDRSAFSAEDLEILDQLAYVGDVKSSWNRYATGYIYVVPVFAIILFIWFIYRVKLYVKAVR